MLQEKIEADLKSAMRSKDTTRVRTLRSLRAALQQKEIEKRRSGESTLTNDEVISVLQKQAKQRTDSIEQFAAAGRDDLEQAEREELSIIEGYLPAKATDEEIRSVVEKAIRETGAASMADMGKVMGAVMSQMKGQADGRRINQIVRQRLADDTH